MNKDKEKVWEKLSTPYHKPINPDMAYFQKALWRGLRTGQLNVVASGKGAGKSVFVDIESDDSV